MSSFTCLDCGDGFDLPSHVIERYPNWTPRQCLRCRNGGRSRGSGARASTRSDLTTGVFTDGGAQHNPGPGGWGAVYVIDDEIVAEEHGHAPHTTNNKMELTALIAGMELVPSGTSAVLYTDSAYVVGVANEWAAGWEKRGWKRKSGPVENLDLVKTLYYGLRRRPELSVVKVKGHSGIKWNEYADELANRWRN